MPIRWYGPSLILLVTVVTVMLMGPGIARSIAWNHSEANIQQVRQELLESPSLITLSESFSKVSTVVEPSVVHVQTFAPSARSGGGFFSRFDPLDPLGNGSGWVYAHTDRDTGETKNYILTNHHVVASATRISVRFADGSEHTARLVNSDELTDVAVLEVPDEFLHPAAISPEPVKKGQIVFAFGSPFRFDFSVSQGIVSASGRQLDIGNSGKYEDFIQTDAAINPGNSGGPLTDIYGRVVGMNTAIASSRTNANDPGGFMGLGFAIPVQMAVDVATRIIEEGDVRRGYLGVLIRDLEPALAESFGYTGKGVLIEHPIGDGPADEAGLLPGDIITHIQDMAVGDVDDLRYTVAGFAPGASIKVTTVRGGQEINVTVTLDDLENQAVVTDLPRRLRHSPAITVQDDRLRELGIGRIADFTLDDARDNNLEPFAGVIVVDARMGSIAARQRVFPQSVITHVGDAPVTTTSELLEAMELYPESLPLRFTVLSWDANLGEMISRFALLEVEPD
ncbi:S1C family serine protease [Algisphaera agarilytica]|uniref:Serine protease Do n=1 Tax=Algisphaera agarilytica TaxID=1385975 RepID=A0A7X0H6Q7_9BACT|nr:trypsin-like peptidase domain-containing protein [Algisphaera agarilytica]MBB6430287.1 serine protease Do [Algisphaera agarilytica]